MKLKSASGWTGRDNGTDAFGLRILPAAGTVEVTPTTSGAAPFSGPPPRIL
jgi:hypothetical protein